jgi:hypothetical protein
MQLIGVIIVYNIFIFSLFYNGTFTQKKKTNKHNPSYRAISQVMNLIREAITRRYYV